MDHIFSLSRRPSKIANILRQSFSENGSHSLICALSSCNILAFTSETDIDDNSLRSWGSHVYIADLNTPWFVHKILSHPVHVTVLQWDFTGELLLVGVENGSIQIYKAKEHLLNEWSLVFKTELLGEHILAAAFFHSGKKICLNSEKKDSSSYLEKFQHVKFKCSVKQFGSKPANGALLLTSTGIIAVILLPQTTSQAPMTVVTESLGPTRIHIKIADICYGKNGHFLLAVTSGDANSPIQCYQVEVRKKEDKCVITSQSLPSFFLKEGGKDVLVDSDKKDKISIKHLKWVMREDADSLLVAAGNNSSSCLQVWELREKKLPVHKLLAGNDPQYYTTVLWQYQSHFLYNQAVTSVATSKLCMSNNMSCGYIVASFADNSIHCLYKDSLKPITNMQLSSFVRHADESNNKYAKTSIRIAQIDMSWMGNVLLAIDTDGSLHLFKLPPQIDSSTPLSVPYVTTMLEYCLVSGFDWLDLLLVVRPGMLDPLCERLTESFSRQTTAIQQFFYVQFLCIKISLYRLSPQGQNKINDLTQLLMLHSISTAFKSLLRPSEMSSHDKSPADSLSSVIAEGQNDVDKVLIYLEAKEFTVEPSTLQSLQQLIQWVADLTLNLLVKLPDSRPSSGKAYELLRDVKALNTLRELLVLIRIWGLLRPACLPVFTKPDVNLDVLALVFRLLSRLVQNPNEPDDSLIDDCCLLPNQVQIQPLQIPNNRVALASPQLAQQTFPIQLEFQNDPDCMLSSGDYPTGQTVDSIRHLYLGSEPRIVKECVRCGAAASTVPVTRTAAIRAWDHRWACSCQCGGRWRIHAYT